ncbi:MAG: hypothetical protein ACOC7U_10365, partial [Spirochaetota bacterium]
MKKLFILLIGFSFFVFMGCSKIAIENTISDFEDAVNKNSTNDIKEVLSTESEMYITTAFDQFLSYFDDFRNVNYSNLDINVDGGDGEVYADATYNELCCDCEKKRKEFSL